MDYDEYNLTMQTILNVPTNNVDSAYQQILPSMINYAELRIYREFDFLATSSSQTAAMVALTRSVALPTNIIVLESANVITPSTTTNPDLGMRNPLRRVSLDYINFVWPSATGASVPQEYALLGNPTIGATLITAGPINIVVGPTPLAAYTLEVIGTIRPTPLSPTNTTTFISTYMTDLFIAASMVFGAGYQRDFGSQADDPKLAQSWENQYQILKGGIAIEEMRKKAQSVQWTNKFPSPIATTPRDRAPMPPGG